MRATIKKWGNSYAVRLPMRELASLDLTEGDEIDVQLARPGGPVDVSDLGFLLEPDGADDVALNHDKYLYGWDRPP